MWENCIRKDRLAIAGFFIHIFPTVCAQVIPSFPPLLHNVFSLPAYTKTTFPPNMSTLYYYYYLVYI